MPDETVLLVDDDHEIREGLGGALSHLGFSVRVAPDGASACRIFDEEELDAIILDISIERSFAPDGVIEDGLTLLTRLRSRSDVPILMLSATTAESVKVLALDLGADDYITKPFSASEVAARIKAVLRRTQAGPAVEPGHRVGDLLIDTELLRVARGGQRIHLTLTEFRVLESLLRARGRVLSRQQILEFVHGRDYYGDERAVDVHVRHLRSKLEADPDNPTIVLTVRGLGYRLGDTEEAT